MKRSFDTAKRARRRLLLSCVASTAMCVLGREVHSQSPYDVECSELPGTLRTPYDVSAAFACKGDRSALAMRALDATEPDVAVQGMIQYLAASYLSLPMLAKAYGMAQSAPTAVRRFVGLNLIANAIYPPLTLSPSDTGRNGDWDRGNVDHPSARTSQELKVEASRMLRELATNAPMGDVRLRAQMLRGRLSAHLIPRDSVPR